MSVTCRLEGGPAPFAGSTLETPAFVFKVHVPIGHQWAYDHTEGDEQVYVYAGRTPDPLQRNATP